MDSDHLELWITRLAGAFGKNIRRETAEVYHEKLGMFKDLTDIQWEKALDKIINTLEYFPTISTIRGFLFWERIGSQQEMMPVFETWYDKEGRPWARQTGRYTQVSPSPQTVAEWKREALTLEAGRQCFKEGIILSGATIEAWRRISGSMTLPAGGLPPNQPKAQLYLVPAPPPREEEITRQQLADEDDDLPF